MNAENKKKNIHLLGKVILIALLIVFLIRTFFIEPFTLSTSQMESSLTVGDRVVVNKTSYGIRLPQTILTIPFTFDSIFGFRSYSKLIELSYTRIFTSKIVRNDIVLFNNPLNEIENIDKRDLLLSRCVGLPGDTVSMQDGLFCIGLDQYPLSPYQMNEFFIKAEHLGEVLKIMENNAIKNRTLDKTGAGSTLALSQLEAYVISSSNADSILITKILRSDENYNLRIPQKGMQIAITAHNLKMYGSAIDYEQGIKCIILNGELLIDGQGQKSYTFEQDYYWLLSDNAINSIDSRSLGFVPFSHIIGKASFIWLKTNNEDGDGLFSFFSTIN